MPPLVRREGDEYHRVFPPSLGWISQMFTGSLVALVTPMHDGGALDYDSLERLIEFHIEEGTDGIVSVGTTGESATLSHIEHEEVVRRTIQYVKGRVPVIAGTGANSTTEAIALTRAAHAAGADACLLVVPYYNKPPQEGLYQHFRAIAEAVAIPQILYNVPGRTACDMHNDTVERLAAISNIIGIKDATADIERGRDLIRRCGTEFTIYSGEDAAAKDLMLAGGMGTISVTANVAPRLMHEMCAAAVSGEEARATELDQRLQPLHKALFFAANPIPVKWAVSEMKLIPSGIRLPLVRLADQFHGPLRDTMHAVGAL